VRLGRLLRVDLAARARELCEYFFHFWSHLWRSATWSPVSLSPASSRSSRVADATNRSRSHFCVFAIVRNLASARRHSCEGSGELGRLPCFQGAQRVHWDLAGMRGAQPDGDPGPFDRCLQLTDSVFKMIALRLGTLHVARPHATREPSVHADGLASASRPMSTERLILRDHRVRRTSDASSLRGLPRRNASVHRRRPAGPRIEAALVSKCRPTGVLRVEPESLGLLCRCA
jgi:hypothetical protein